MMTMKVALNLFNLNGSISKDLLKKSYRKLCSKYHPDRNPSGLEMMKVINVAHDYLLDQINHSETHSSWNGADWFIEIPIKDMIVFRSPLKTTVSGKTYPFREILKKHSFRWNPTEKIWWVTGDYPIEKYL
jgi:YHS domain-containing protein